MTVYFIQAGENGPIKIGSATNVAARKSMIQSHNHERVHLLCVLGGGFALEAKLRSI